MQETGLFAWFGFLLPLRERLELMAEAEFTHASLWWGPEFEEMDGPLSLHPELARNAGLRIDSIHLPYADSNSLWLDTLAGDAFHRQLLTLIRSCGDHRIPIAVLHPNDGPNPPAFSAIGLNRMQRLVETAESSKVVLALEDLHVPGILDDLYGRIDSPALGFCYDSGHDRIFGRPDQNLPAKYAQRLKVLHLHDNDGTRDLHGLPGEGDIAWDALIAGIRDSGYSGVWSLESMKEYREENDASSKNDVHSAGFKQDVRTEALVWLRHAHRLLESCLSGTF